jgi:pimeloyl-ACP methyl ester carboxylesterase
MNQVTVKLFLLLKGGQPRMLNIKWSDLSFLLTQLRYNNTMINQESLFLPQGEHQLHLRHVWQKKGGIPIFMLHGVIENGLIFYTKKGKGLACYLAEQGFDVYVADLRGRGESTPLIDKNAEHGQFEAITQDIPLFINYISEITEQKIHLVAHSWGGVLMASALVRFPKLITNIRSKTCFGTKRMVTVKNVEKLFKINIVWNNLALKLANKKGFLDAKCYGMGSDNETIKSLVDSVAWTKKSDWHDPRDGFDYCKAAKLIDWPPTWHFTGSKDKALGHATDVNIFIKEYNPQAKFTLLSKSLGNMQNYDHINILTHPDATVDHFPKLVTWLKSH